MTKMYKIELFLDECKQDPDRVFKIQIFRIGRKWTRSATLRGAGTVSILINLKKFEPYRTVGTYVSEAVRCRIFLVKEQNYSSPSQLGKKNIKDERHENWQ